MLSVYTNQQDLLRASSETKVSRIETVDLDLLNLDSDQFSVILDNKTGTPNLELHV